MESWNRISDQDKARNANHNVRGEHLFSYIESWSCSEYKIISEAKCLEIMDSVNTGVKKIKTYTEHLPSRQIRNADSVLENKCKAHTRNAVGQKHEVKERKFISEKEQERKFECFESNKVKPFAFKQDAQFKNQDVENYLDTALQDIRIQPLGIDSVQTLCDLTSANNYGYEGNGSHSLCRIDPNNNPSEPMETMSTINQPAILPKEFTDNDGLDPEVGDDESDLGIDSASLDCQYHIDCDDSLQIEESGGFSSFSIMHNSTNRQRYLLYINESNISEKMTKSRHFEYVQSDSGIDSDYSSESHSAHSVSSTELIYSSCKSNSLEDPSYSAQSELPVVFQQSESSHMIPSESIASSCYYPEESDAVFSHSWSKSQFSSQPEFSHSGMPEEGPCSVRLISSPAECTEESKLVLSEGQGKPCFSTLLESCQSDSLKQYNCSPDSEQIWSDSLREFSHSTLLTTSLHERVGESENVSPKISSQSDKEMESSSFRHCLSSHGQRQSEMQSVISDQQYVESDKSHDIAFFKTTNSNILLKSKVAFDDSIDKIGHETGRFNISSTEICVHEKPLLIRPGVFCEKIQRHNNVQNRVYYWHQVMQLYFTLATALSVGGSLNWLFQLRPVTLQALQRLQSILNYPFTNLNGFFDCESRESPPSAEERMSVEWMRLQTFQNYPDTAHGCRIRLARGGFYYTGQGTQTRCFSCGVSHGEWNLFDNPHEVHRRLSPNCPFLNGRQEGHRNIPMSPDESGDVGRADRDSIPTPSLPFAPLPGSGTGQSQAEGNRSVSTVVPQTSKTTDEDDKILQQQRESAPGIQSHPVEESAQSEADNRPKFPENTSLPTRIATFSHGWPPYLDQTPQQMAEAGFFFTGNQDYTRCYQCGGGLRNWEPGDNPWIEHCRWYPTCPHIQKGKGQRFVNAVLKKQAELLATQRAECRRKAQYGIGSTDPLETLAAITLLEMGYPRDTVRNSILILRRQKEPAAEITALEVLDFIWKEEDIERQRQEEEASRPHHPGDAQPPALPTLMEHLNLGGSPAVTQAAVLQSASITTSASSITTAVITTTSATLAISSASGTSSTAAVSTSTSASGATQSTDASSQGQGKDQGISKGSVEEEIAAKNHEESKQGEQRPSGAVGGQSEGPGVIAQAVAALIDEDEEFHSLDPEEMENRDYGELEEENKRLKEQTTCKICMENPISVIFLPCGHLVCCEPCAPAFRKCPICRKRIQQSFKTFL